MKIKTLSLVFMFSAFLFACSNDDNKTPQTNLQSSNDSSLTNSSADRSSKANDSTPNAGKIIANNQSKKWNKYNIMSGFVEYRLSGIDGTESVYWQNYGALELRNSRTKQTRDGKSIETNSLVLYIDSSLYQIDLIEKKGIRINLNKYLSGRTDMKVFSKDLLKQLNGERKGTEVILGRQCDVWLLGDGAKVCLFNDIPFRIEMGKIKIEAVKYVENPDIPKDLFVLPKGIDFKDADSPSPV